MLLCDADVSACDVLTACDILIACDVIWQLTYNMTSPSNNRSQAMKIEQYINIYLA
jgi:hypothetical protein